jgi:hypothetical protein
MRSVARHSKGIWSEREDSVLAKLVINNNGKTWKEIAKLLNTKCGEMKTGKQCRERYRNYVNPKIYKAAWKPLEKLLFIILQQVYSNCWKDIGKCLKGRSDVTIKNYFYYTIRKVAKQVNNTLINASLLRSPEKFYRQYSVLMYIKKHYLPDIKNMDAFPKYYSKEHTILKFLFKRRVTEEAISSYQDRMLNAFKLAFASSNLPIEIIIPLKSFSVAGEKLEELNDLQNTYNVFPLSEVIQVKIGKDNEEFKSGPLTSLNNHEQSVSQPDCTLYFINFYNCTPYPHLFQPLGSIGIFPQPIYYGNNDFPQIVFPGYGTTIASVINVQVPTERTSLNEGKWFYERRNEDKY